MILVGVVHQPGFDTLCLQCPKQLESLANGHAQIVLAVDNQARRVEVGREQVG